MLVRVLWGYPKLVDACPFSVLADVRKKNMEEQETTDGPEGRHPELPGGGDTTRYPSPPYSPSRENQASMESDAHPDVHGVYNQEDRHHLEEDPQHPVTWSGLAVRRNM